MSRNIQIIALAVLSEIENFLEHQQSSVEASSINDAESTEDRKFLRELSIRKDISSIDIDTLSTIIKTWLVF
jgi:hypothetical protein